MFLFDFFVDVALKTLSSLRWTVIPYVHVHQSFFTNGERCNTPQDPAHTAVAPVAPEIGVCNSTQSDNGMGEPKGPHPIRPISYLGPNEASGQAWRRVLYNLVLDCVGYFFEFAM